MSKKNLKKNFIGMIILGIIALFFSFVQSVQDEEQLRYKITGSYSDSITIGFVGGGILLLGGIIGVSSMKGNKYSANPQSSWCCKGCGIFNPGDKKFCSDCGKPNEQPVSQQTGEKCPHCKESLPTGAAFCRKCGLDLNNGWICNCGYINIADELVCEGCNTSRLYCSFTKQKRLRFLEAFLSIPPRRGMPYKPARVQGG